MMLPKFPDLLYILPIISFFLCFVLTPVIRQISLHKGWVAKPRKERWHKNPTAIMGGIAIYIGVSLPIYFISDFSSVIQFVSGTSGHFPLPSIPTIIWIGMTLLFIIGLVDDYFQIKPYTKFIGQLLVASLVAFLGFRIHWFESLTVDTIVTIFWIVGITNAFNLIDNMDGLCAGIALITSIFTAMMFFETQPNAAIISLILATALAAFLVYNFNPASIFMGDSGSLPIGYTLAILAFSYSKISVPNSISTYAVPILLLVVPIFDMTLVSTIRVLSGRKMSDGGKDHSSHRLVLIGLSEREAVFFLYLVSIVSGVGALFITMTDSLTSPAVIVPILLSMLLLGIYLAQLRVYPEKEFSFLRDKSYTPLLKELTYKKQILLIMFDFCLITFAYYLSYRLRFESNEFSFYFKIFLKSLPIIIVCKLIAFFVMGIYRPIWEYVSFNDVLMYLKASLLGTVLSVASVAFIYRFKDFSKGVFIIDWFLMSAFILGSRGSFRLFMEFRKRKALSGDKVLIYGAGKGGELLLRELLNNGKLKMNPVGFIDDDLYKKGKKIQGYPIIGTSMDLDGLAKKHQFQGILISFKNGDSESVLKVKSFCRNTRLFS